MKKVNFWKILFIVTCVCLFFTGVIAGLIYHYNLELPPISQLEEYELMNGTKVFDKDGNLVKIFASEHRRSVPLSEISDTLISAFIAMEDENFYDHMGIDFASILRAFLANFSTGSIRQGASTITQQLARDMFLTLEQSMDRKIKEALLSFKIERTFSKDQILEMYLNKTYLGGGNYGVESAAQNYFGKSSKDLTLAECALLARIPQAPTYLNPRLHYDEVVRRSKFVLAQMYELGYIDETEYYQAYYDTVEITTRKKAKQPADYFYEYVRKYIEQKYGTSMLYNGGLQVFTTLDLDLTNYADSVLNNHLVEFENKLNYDVKYDEFPADTFDIDTKYVQGGVYAVEPNTGYVRAMIGGRNFNHSKFNRVLQARRQPGSAFKPFIYTAAVANGYTAATMINDLPLVFLENDTIQWRPPNYSDKFYGLTRLRIALKHSRNIPVIKIFMHLTPYEVIKYAERLGIDSPLYPFPALSLGSAEVYPAELISAYCPFANGGKRVDPIYIKRIDDETGKMLEEYLPHSSQVIGEDIAYLMTNLMESVVDGGTAGGIRWRGFYLPAAGKTGTTDNYQDAWCIAYTTQLVLGIWVGFDDNITLGKGQAGAYVAVPPWPYIMKRAVYNSSPKDSTGKAIINKKLYEFKEPDNIVHVTISEKTGLLAQPFEKEVTDEIFIRGTEPTILSDSLGYNFEPIGYQDLSLDTLYIDMDEYYRTMQYRKSIKSHRAE
ncbi:MAG: PBP1A family penicillin-binding protein [Candidatus Cloacimonetes bacterium]|nr:PBP1A family penicillin-binding protein [Candidatus Cloacimonadota bacterium]